MLELHPEAEDGVRGDRIPLAYTTGKWPDEVAVAEDAPIGVHYSLAVARRLADYADEHDQSHRAMSTAAGLATNTVGRIIRGEGYPDLASLARLEAALRIDLYPSGLYRTVPQDSSPHPDQRAP
ncbi:helix-turn-helix domain-containing protein [Streptomyces botrytidirepellens]|uniref:XRE family transcriptional regulator n=1 Tax=Streptomyces botrytidirepellens TaxID=2486417 RepID=A0A3M8T6B6_9ACTN|nr:helix-turn-helix transcriptional regulator [Streptomyces botrytidirepellens]RNF86760.1 XRE family transcriptional regulator [Streptomyces botrytidirepellens]